MLRHSKASTVKSYRYQILSPVLCSGPCCKSGSGPIHSMHTLGTMQKLAVSTSALPGIAPLGRVGGLDSSRPLILTPTVYCPPTQKLL